MNVFSISATAYSLKVIRAGEVLETSLFLEDDSANRRFGSGGWGRCTFPE
jgi:hypothetical protein